jgi:C1A family cysteine protease
MSRSFTLLSVTAAVACASNTHERGYYEEKFFNWMQEHKIQVPDGHRFITMLQNFANNDDIIEQHNGQNLSYKLGHNKFSHMDINEWREAMKLGLGYPANTVAEKIHEAPKDLKSNPASIDWRDSGAVTPVKDQGNCGSCWSFSTTGALEGAHQIASGSLVSLSEQNFVDCDDNGDHGCHGGLMDNAFAWAKSNGGVCSEDDYAYTARKGSCEDSTCGTHYATPKSYTDVVKNSEDALMSALAQQPVSVAIEADQSTFQLYKSGVLTAECGTNLDHGVLAVGYGTDSGVNYWTVKNSWGDSWGESGYIRLSRDVSQKQGQCGILSGPPSYPNM